MITIYEVHFGEEIELIPTVAEVDKSTALSVLLSGFGVLMLSPTEVLVPCLDPNILAFRNQRAHDAHLKGDG